MDGRYVEGNLSHPRTAVGRMLMAVEFRAFLAVVPDSTTMLMSFA